jgi:hypothetical protein
MARACKLALASILAAMLTSCTVHFAADGSKSATVDGAALLKILSEQ